MLTLAIGFSIAGLFYTQMKSALDRLSDQLFDRTALMIEAQVSGERTQIAHALAFTARSDLARGPAADAVDVLGETLADNAWVVAAYAGYPNGDFVLLRRRPAERTILGSMPAQTRFVLQRIDHRDGAARGSYAFYDAYLHLLTGRPAPEYRFDPRVRPWYGAAGTVEATLTAPYVFFTTHDVGITMSLAAPAGAVLAADIDLASVSEQFAQLRPTPGSQSALVGSDGAVLAYSDPTAFARMQRSATGDRAPRLAALGSAPLDAAFAAAGRRMRAGGTYRDALGRTWIFRVAPVSVGGGVQAGLILSVPTDELYAAANRARRDAALVCVALVLLWVPLTFWLSRFIASPLTALRTHALALRNRDYTDRTPPGSVIAEIDEFGATFDAMRRQIRHHNQAVTRFVPQQFLEQLSRDDIVSIELGDHAERRMTILFSDIRSFTSLSESMTPQQTFNFLNSYLTRVGPIIRDHRGFIDKYIGDAIMGLFPADPRDAVEAAIAMQRRVVEYNLERARAGYAPIAIGVGLHTGDLMLGTIGETERFETTVIADAVNVSARLESLTKTFGSKILASGQVIESIAADALLTRRLGDVQVVGTTRGITVFEICDADPPELAAHKRRTGAQFEAGRIAYADGDFAVALDLFAAVADDDPNDRAAAYFRDRAAALAAAASLSVWDGVERMDAK